MNLIHKTQKRAAFTLIEMVFVIVIVGIVSVAGAKALVQILKNYALQKEYAKIELDSAAAIRSISRALQNSVWDSIAIHLGGQYAPLNIISRPGDPNNANDVYAWEVGMIGEKYGRELVFIEKNMDIINGYYDSTKGENMPFFNGYIDIDSSSGENIVNFNTWSETTGVISGVSSKGVKANVMALYFPFINVGTSANNVATKYYQNTTSQNLAIFPIRDLDGNGNFILYSAPRQIGDVAVIVNTNPAYITIEDGTDTNYQAGDLVIERYESQGTGNTWRYNKEVIARNVSNLHLWTETSSSLIRTRICFKASVLTGIMDEFCKEGIIMQ